MDKPKLRDMELLLTMMAVLVQEDESYQTYPRDFIIRHSLICRNSKYCSRVRCSHDKMQTCALRFLNDGILKSRTRKSIPTPTKPNQMSILARADHPASSRQLCYEDSTWPFSRSQSSESILAMQNEPRSLKIRPKCCIL